MPEIKMHVTDREGFSLDFQPRKCPFCGDLIDDPRDWWPGKECCTVCGFFTSAEERDQFNQKWGLA